MTRDWNMRKSSMQSYKYCQRYFYYAIIEGIPAPVSPYRAQLGTNFHAHSAEFYDVVDVRKEPTYTYYRSLLPQVEAEPNGWYDSFAQFEVNRMNYILGKQMDPYSYFLPIAKELRIVLDDHMMEGTIDRIWRLDNDEPCIQDVKAKLPDARTSLRRELCFYTYMCNHHEPIASEWGPFKMISGYGYREAVAWVEELKSRTEKAMFKLLDIIDYDISNRFRKEDWPRNTWAFCHDCPYNYDCWVAAGEDIPMPDLMKNRGKKKEEGTWKKFEGGG